MSFMIPFHDYGGRGPLLHFAHANAYPPGSYRLFLNALTRNFQVLAVKHRPLWPQAQPQEMSSWHRIADDLIEFFDQQKLQGVIGVGHSLGGVATMVAAAKRPELFSQLILIDPVFLAPHLLAMVDERIAQQLEPFEFPLVAAAQRRRDWWSSRAAAFEHLRPKSVFAGFSDEAMWDFINYGLTDDANGGVRLAFPKEWEARIYSMPPTFVWEYVSQISQPTLAIRAANSDTLFPPSWENWQKLQPGATFIEMPETTHLLTMEKPEAVANLIARWTKDLRL
ncbi:MAG: alpha/beta hydrolase [Chloroflexi bacterium]|nr:alpha/beta hydrolase [Chloroflexota bacterium]MBP8054248.1 alpha/beta hydrolase [Chloroflexota bacterium]